MCLEKWNEEKKAANERARIKKEENKKKAIKFAKIGVPAIAAIAVIVLLTITLFIPMIRFNKADKLFTEGKYDKAKIIYQELGGFGKSDMRVATINAIGQVEEKQFERGINTLLAAGVPVELTYQTGGGSFGGTQGIFNDQKTVVFTTPSDFTCLTTPERNGYRFLEWVLDNYTYDVDTKDANFCLTLKSIWSTKDYVVKYDLNGGNVVGSNITEYDPEDESFTIINPTRTGYTFAGWTGTDLLEPTIDVAVPTGSYGDRSYTATWKANE